MSSRGLDKGFFPGSGIPYCSLYSLWITELLKLRRAEGY